MKTFYLKLAAIAAPLLLSASCQDLFHQDRTGTLLITLRDPVPAATRSGQPLPDPGAFRLTVTDASGKSWYDGAYSHAPDELTVSAGAYTVRAVSDEFSAPAYDSPQWGDEQVVTVPAGGSISVELVCHQMNSGLRLEVEDSFRRAFPAGSLWLQGTGGSLEYTYGEPRTAYFRPGPLAALLDDGGFRQTLFSRTLEACQILTIRLGAASSKAGGISLSIDTTRTWLSEHFTLGGEGAGDISGAYDVAAARNHPGEQDVWVHGYIVGVATNTKKVGFSGPFTKNTNLVLGTKASTTDIDHCLTVELPSGPVRSALNLQDHPELLGRKVYIKGDLVSAYYGIPGLKSPQEYQLN